MRFIYTPGIIEQNPITQTERNLKIRHLPPPSTVEIAGLFRRAAGKRECLIARGIFMCDNCQKYTEYRVFAVA